MAGNSLTITSTLQCPHGGQVQIISSNTQAKGGGALLVTQSDTFAIIGCPFTLPPAVPSPCTTVKWIVADLQSTAGGVPTLSQSSVGLCLNGAQAPQGAVIVVSAQSSVRSR